MLMRVDLEQPEWNQLLAILAQAPWNVANPLIMKIGEQLRQQVSAGATVGAGRPNGPLEAPEDLKPSEGRLRPS